MSSSRVNVPDRPALVLPAVPSIDSRCKELCPDGYSLPRCECTNKMLHLYQHLLYRSLPEHSRVARLRKWLVSRWKPYERTNKIVDVYDGVVETMIDSDRHPNSYFLLLVHPPPKEESTSESTKRLERDFFTELSEDVKDEAKKLADLRPPELYDNLTIRVDTQTERKEILPPIPRRSFEVVSRDQQGKKRKVLTIRPAQSDKVQSK